MIKITKFRELFSVYAGVRDTIRDIVEERELKENTLNRWKEHNKRTAFTEEYKEEFHSNKHSLSNDLFERYLKTTYFYAKEWGVLYQALNNSLYDLLKTQSSYSPLISELFSAAMSGGGRLHDQIEWVKREYDIKNIQIEADGSTQGPEGDGDKLSTASKNQKILVLWYLNQFNRLKLTSLGQDQTKQATIVSFLIDRSYKTTYDALSKPTEHFTKKNLLVVLELFKKHEAEYLDIIEQVEKDFKNAV